MKVNENETQDRYGQYPVCWVSGKDATPQNIHEWLFSNGYSGYKFAIVFDCTQDEWEEPGKETPVYFLDCVAEEMLEYIGRENVERWLKEKSEVQP